MRTVLKLQYDDNKRLHLEWDRNLIGDPLVIPLAAELYRLIRTGQMDSDDATALHYTASLLAGGILGITDTELTEAHIEGFKKVVKAFSGLQGRIAAEGERQGFVL